jgi:NADPH-dependent glutamate synthase beta subunit-like oxidoreductase
MVPGEIATILGLGVEVKNDTRIGSAKEFSDLQSGFDAVLLACGATAREQVQQWGLPVGERGIQVSVRTCETKLPGVFAAGTAVRGKAMAVHSVADGKEVAASIDQFLCGLPVTGAAEPFSTKIGRMGADELVRFAAGASDASRQEPAEGFTPAAGVEQAARCLHCDCRGLKSCKLRKYAAMYNAQPRRYKAGRRVFEQDSKHAEVIYEPGKCIDCGLCIQIAAAAGEPLGLTFVGRGFDVRVGVPLDRPLAEALTQVAAQCVAACPTAALAWKHEV